MWWVKLCNPPPNLHIVVSTLDKEKGTFSNTKKMVPNALSVRVHDMDVNDATKIVTSVLNRYNKKLTRTNDSFLGNQISSLIIKNNQPLFLTAATQAIRVFGVFEKLSEFIEDLPNEVPSLFEFLIKGWIDEYGKEFIRDVCSIICVSVDGVLENALNDILSFVEKTENIDYNSSFSHLFEAMKDYLAAGGSGHIRFYHDQINKVVQKMWTVLPKNEYIIFYLRIMTNKLHLNSVIRLLPNLLFITETVCLQL